MAPSWATANESAAADESAAANAKYDDYEDEDAQEDVNMEHHRSNNDADAVVDDDNVHVPNAIANPDADDDATGATGADHDGVLTARDDNGCCLYINRHFDLEVPVSRMHWDVR